MEITVSNEAIQWFKSEMDLVAGEGIRFFGKVYGKTNVHEGFSIGIAREIATTPLVKTEIDGLIFSIDATDDWFFSGYDLTVDYDAAADSPVYHFEPAKSSI
ncbi:HesB/YadR/YfhF family protein [Agrilactobacillus yilanensis]|uniref:HesB/YadR/YfhF family protein n=1 Tax=Agrilactobacillus yilanensis TaxID=2485997 RepID=A0ABW4JAY9_9LACO|nr:iron-sulfur cluster biosynthesis protein [Agrilactobacillus yilanensis]